MPEKKAKRKPQRVEYWAFVKHPNHFCLPEEARTLSTPTMFSAGISHVNLYKREVIVCTGDVYELGQPSDEYVKWLNEYSAKLRSWSSQLEEWIEEAKSDVLAEIESLGEPEKPPF